MSKHVGLPVPGYVPQSDAAVAHVTQMKVAEEKLLRTLDAFRENPEVDQRWLAIGRTAIEQGFMAINRSIFKPARVKLPGED